MCVCVCVCVYFFKFINKLFEHLFIYLYIC